MKIKEGENMKAQEMIVKMREDYAAHLPFMNQEEKRFLTLKEDKKGRLRGFFTREYWRRNRLVIEGNIAYAYIFKSYQFDLEHLEDGFLTWLLFSPSSFYDEHPEAYKDIAIHLLALENRKPTSKKEKEMKRYIEEELSEPHYVEVPKEWTDGHLVYLCSAYIYQMHIPIFHLGFIPVFHARQITKEILLLPYKYWSEDWKKFYEGGKNI